MPDLAKSDWPEFSAELDRKTLAAISRYGSAHEKGAITRRELYLILTALYDSTSGLIPRETSELIALTREDIRRGKI